MNGLITPLSLLFVVVLAGCSSTASPSQAETASSSGSEPTASIETSTSPTEATTSAPVAGGTATDFCGSFKELQAVMEAPSGDIPTLAAQMQAAAADMRKYAPAEIEQAANTYADVMDNIGKAAASGSLDPAALAKAISDGVAGNAKDIGTTAAWVATNCDL